MLFQNPQVFISYAWEAEKADLDRQQAHLRQIVEDLTLLGFPTCLTLFKVNAARWSRDIFCTPPFDPGYPG
jgi:hypothetical protein